MWPCWRKLVIMGGLCGFKSPCHYQLVLCDSLCLMVVVSRCEFSAIAPVHFCLLVAMLLAMMKIKNMLNFMHMINICGYLINCISITSCSLGAYHDCTTCIRLLCPLHRSCLFQNTLHLTLGDTPRSFQIQRWNQPFSKKIWFLTKGT